jgi:hypothetical protein
MLFVKTGRRIKKPLSVRLFEEPIQWLDNARHHRVTLDKQLTWSTFIDQVRKKAAQRLGALGPLLNRRSGLFIGNDFLLYKQLIRPMVEYVCPVWKSATRSHIKKLQALQSKFFRTVSSAPW